MKLVFIITGLSTGGAENMQLNLLERIDLKKFSCQVISLTDVGEIGIRMAALGIPVETLGMRRGMPGPIRFVRLVRRLQQIKPDVVHTWMYHANLMGGLAARMARIPTVIWGIRSSDFLRADTSLATRVVVSLCAKVSSWLPDCILYNSQKGIAYHKKLGYAEHRSLVVPNGVNLEKFKPSVQARHDVRRELGVPVIAPLVGLIARFDPLKNHEGFIKAAACLQRDMPEVHFLMVGQDVEWSNPVLKNLIEEARLTRVFHLLGRRDDIPRITASLNVASLTSWSEAFPNVLIEAMACGVPCVSTDAGDAAMILGDAGRIVPTGNMEGLAAQWAALLRLPENEWRLYGERARARAMEQFELGVVVKRYEAMYLDVFKQKDLIRKNLDANVVKDFGSEWSRFDQSGLSATDHAEMFDDYFHIFPWAELPSNAVGADIGCGSGRWAALVAPRVGHLHLVDPSGEALSVARQNLASKANTSFHQASVDNLHFDEGSLDFAYALGVLHHVPDTREAIKSIALILKSGAPFLIYLYYAFDQRSWWFRALWRGSDMIRRVVSRMPVCLKDFVCDGIALFVYLPLARTGRLLDQIGILPSAWPLAYYRDREFYVLRTDALDRFGTRLEQRFTRHEIETMLLAAGFENIKFSDRQPFWCAVGTKLQA